MMSGGGAALTNVCVEPVRTKGGGVIMCGEILRTLEATGSVWRSCLTGVMVLLGGATQPAMIILGEGETAGDSDRGGCTRTSVLLLMTGEFLWEVATLVAT